MNFRFLLSLFASLTLLITALAGPRDAQWAEVEKARRDGLPKSAIAALEPIITSALADRAYPEALNALGQKIALEGAINGNKPEEKITRMLAALETAPAEMKPILEAITARWYWHYFQQNRYRFLQRTQTTAAPGADFQTWDLARILTEIDRRFTAALADEKLLQSIPISDYNELLTRGTAPDNYRPTLYDFIAHEALAFYQAGEQGAISAEDEFELDSDSQIFASAKDFMLWQLAPASGYSPKRKAVMLYQSLLRFHAHDTDRTAFLDADLARFEYARNVATGENNTSRYLTALESLAKNASNNEVSAAAYAAIAAKYQREGNLARAHAYASKGRTTFPLSIGGRNCFNLIAEIERPELSLSTERVWNAAGATLDVTYKNCTKVYFRMVAINLADRLKDGKEIVGEPRGYEVTLLLEKKPVRAWAVELPPTVDFALHTEHLPVPSDLAPGPYLICASSDESFDKSSLRLGTQVVWVSDLALVVDGQRKGTGLGGYVLNAVTGEPITGADVQAYRFGEGWMEPADEPLKTDRDGRFFIPNSSTKHPVLLHAHSRGHHLVSDLVWTQKPDRERKAAEYTLLFTDRAIYRPGQRVFYKGVCAHAHASRGDYEVLAGEKVTVIFRDVNDQIVAEARQRTNDYGSFSGSFIAPSDLTGEMTISVEKGPRGQVEFSVEEYKRPKFEVTWQPPADAPKLGENVSIRGKASAYTGAPIGDAKVAWRVERLARLPRWCWWWRAAGTKAIAHGVTTTQADGTFVVEFVAEADRMISPKDEPVFTYNISADVTDTTGETRSEQTTLSAGYCALETTVWAAEWLTPETPVSLHLRTTSLDGVEQAAPLKVKVYALKQPEKVRRAELDFTSRWSRSDSASRELSSDHPDPERWPDGELQWERSLTSDERGNASVEVSIPVGHYRVRVEAQDKSGRISTTLKTLRVLDPQARQLSLKVPEMLAAQNWKIEPGETFTALWGTGYESGRALVEFWSAGKLLKRHWTTSGRTQEKLSLFITEELRGGVTLRTLFVHENRCYEQVREIEVPWSDRELKVSWERFRSKLAPGQKETWTAVIKGPKAEQFSAEMVAGLYDASLDQFRLPAWPGRFVGFRQEQEMEGWRFSSYSKFLGRVEYDYDQTRQNTVWLHRRFAEEMDSSTYWFGDLRTYTAVPESSVVMRGSEEVVLLSPFQVNAEAEAGYTASATLSGSRSSATLSDYSGGAAETGSSSVELSLSELAAEKLNHVTARKDFNETAFFFPHLESDQEGEVRISFTMPESVTTWRFMGFAHDAQLRSGFLTDKVVTAKDLMVQPNPPRFVREGDVIEFTVKVTNQSDQPQRGNVRLSFADAASLESVDTALGNLANEKTFDVPARQSRSYTWRISVPDGLGFLTYKAVGATEQASDGEEGFLPVLSRRVLVTESLPLSIRGPGSKTFDFAKLRASENSDTLRHESLTVQMVSQPAWYAVMALPYLMEFPHECSEQLFNRLYANSLARHIANSDPKIRRVFELWKNTPALDSPLAKNQDLKSVMIEETPWLRQATAESEARRNLGLLFDANRLDSEVANILRALSERQNGDGLWAWFPGGDSSQYISLYVATGFGRLRHLGVEIDITPALKAMTALDVVMANRHRFIIDHENSAEYVPSYLDALYLYGRSFFLKERPISAEHKEAVDFFLKQSRTYWLQIDSRQSQAHLALGLLRFGDQETALAIARSLKERSVSNDELGMFWRDSEVSWWWHLAPVETQAMMIEVFSEVTQDAEAVEDCKVWLLKQKQTQNWKTTKATADAIYALLLRGEKLLSRDALVEVSLGGNVVKPQKVEAGTGFYEEKLVRAEIKPAMGKITVKKTDRGVSWGGVHWQYLEDISKITSHADTPLKLKKALFTKENSASGPVLKAVDGALSVGDELVVRLELRVDRDMEYVHLKDQRGSGTEPVDVLSGYRWQDGLGYYESTRDTASHFYIDYLPKGTYVFEYSTRVQLRGRYQTGIAEIQCMYAPEFSSHSESVAIEVK